MTVHGSKGLEADYVVVLGLCSGRNEFPTEITDDSLLDLVLSMPEGHPNAEEPSPFVKELIDNRYDVTVFGQLPESDVILSKVP